MMWSLGVKRQPRTTVPLRLTEMHMVVVWTWRQGCASGASPVSPLPQAGQDEACAVALASPTGRRLHPAGTFHPTPHPSVRVVLQETRGQSMDAALVGTSCPCKATPHPANMLLWGTARGQSLHSPIPVLILSGGAGPLWKPLTNCPHQLLKPHQRCVWLSVPGCTPCYPVLATAWQPRDQAGPGAGIHSLGCGVSMSQGLFILLCHQTEG